jgi:hypothetical protein
MGLRSATSVLLLPASKATGACQLARRLLGCSAWGVSATSVAHLRLAVLLEWSSRSLRGAATSATAAEQVGRLLVSFTGLLLEVVLVLLGLVCLACWMG